MYKEFEIFYDDLTPKAQEELCKLFKTTPENENWEVFPLAVVPRDQEEIDTEEE